MEQEILVQVDDALKLAQSTLSRTASAHEARLYADAALQAEVVKTLNGASTPFFVLQYQQRVTDARILEIRAQADYLQALIQLALREGTTLEKRHITVEGTGPEK